MSLFFWNSVRGKEVPTFANVKPCSGGGVSGRSHLCVFQAIGQWQSAVEMLQTIGFELVMHSKTGAYVTVRVD